LFTPLPYGLLSSLRTDIREPDDPHWQSGITWESICAEGGTTYDECWAVTGTGSAPAPSEKSPTAAIGRRGALPFTVYSAVDCSAPGFWDRAQELLDDTFTQSEQWQVENAVWSGTAGGQPVVWPRLASNADNVEATTNVTLGTAADVVGDGTAIDIVTGLGELEKALANCYDGVGVIHAPRNLLAPMANAHLIQLDSTGTRYRTVGGNMIVFGAGYSGTGPAGQSTDNETWMYATGAVMIYRGPVQVMPPASGLNRSNNSLTALAERTYLVGWDCCHLAVNISTGPAGAA